MGKRVDSGVGGLDCQLPTKELICWLLITALAVTSLHAEEDEGNHTAETTLSIVALGPMPPRRYSEGAKRGDAAMLLPMEDEVPPNQLYYQAEGNASEALSKWLAFPVAFNNASACMVTKGGVEITLHRKHANDYKPYVTIPALKAGMRHVVFLTPRSGGRDGRSVWMERPQVTVISPDAAGLLGKQFIIKNLSDRKVLHAFGDSVRSIDPGDLLAYRRSQSGVLYRLAARYGDKRHILYNMAVRIDEGSGTHLYALYDARAETNAGRSVGVFRMLLPAQGP